MIDLQQDWSISFAGCGFMGIYYVGACSCVLQRFPRFIRGASGFFGSSAGALIAAALSSGIPLEKCCSDLMFMAKEARKHKLGPLHPGYKLLQIVQDSLERCLPEDAHIRASGKLHVSLTRVSDGKNVLVSEFDSREELMQALICSCFVPFYCGVIPPTYRGVHYVDGAVSDNLPRCHLKNTITFSAYAGEIDLCPRLSSVHLHHVRFNNMSIQINSENIYRVTNTFFPPEAEAMAQICQNGYMDALRFLQDNNLIGRESPEMIFQPCCEFVKDPTAAGASSGKTQEEEEEVHQWLDPQLIDKLPVHIKKALCESCRETHAAGGLLSQVTGYLPKIPSLLPVDSACSLAQRLVDWIPVVPKDMSWLYGLAGDVYKQAWAGSVQESDSESPLRRCTSLPLDLNLCDLKTPDSAPLPLTPAATPTSTSTSTSGLAFTWNERAEADRAPLTPPLTPSPARSSTSGFGAVAASPQGSGGGWGLGRAVGWIRNIASDQTSNQKKTEDSATFPASK